MSKKLTTSEFISRAKEIHGRCYDYSLVNYEGMKKTVIIKCRKHGTFPRTPKDHLSGQGCRQCGIDRAREKKTISLDEFLVKARKKHGDRFDYSKAKYQGWDQFIKIICSIHDVFETTPNKHLFTKNGGCGDCAKRPKKDTKQFIRDARKVHGMRYLYSQVNYVNDSTPVTIICRKQGHDTFTQSPTHHLQGKNCPECAGRPKKDTERFIRDAKKKHGNYYNYSKVIYENGKTKVIVGCPIHGDFSMTPSHHLGGEGCSDCGEYGFKQSEPGLLYYLRLDTPFRKQPLYKIGITNQDMGDRIKTIRGKDGTIITVLYKCQYKTGESARRREKKIIEKNSQFKYLGRKIIASGFTEVFNRDILGIDKK